MTQPTPEHNDAVLVLCHALRNHVRRNKLGRLFLEPDVYLPDGCCYIPDIVFISTDRMAVYDERSKTIQGAPDLCVEVLSARPSRDLVDKFKVYTANQVPWYWVVDPDELTIEEYRLVNNTYERAASVTAGEPFKPLLFPGLLLDLKRLLEANDD